MTTHRKPLSSITFRESGLERIPISKIVPGSFQPRQYFDPHKITQLSQTIKKHGIVEPLLVRLIPNSQNYELIAGERRFRAAKEAHLSDVPVLVRELSDLEATEIALLDNLQREDLNPLEETEGILHLLSIRLGQSQSEVISLLYRLQNQHKGKTTHNVVGNEEKKLIETVFEELGQLSWESFVNHRLRLLSLPEDILQVLREGKIAYTKATAIAKVPDEVIRQQLLEEAIAEELSLSQIRSRIKQRLKPSPSDSPVVSLKEKGEQIFKRLSKSSVWEDPPKQKQLEKLLEQLENLLS